MNYVHVINVAKFGAIGDGSTDDSGAIQAAINSIPQTTPRVGATLFFPLGQYKINTMLSFGARQSVRLLGEGGVGWVEGSGFGSALVSGTPGMTLMKFDGISAVNHYGPILQNLNFRDTAGGSTAVSVRLTNHGTFDNCTFKNFAIGVNLNADSGVVVGGDTAWWIFDQCRWHVNSGISNAIAIKAVESPGFLVQGGAMRMLGVGNKGIELSPLCASVRVMGVKFDKGIGIDCQGFQTHIIGCDFEGTSPGVKLYGDTLVHASSGSGNAIIGCGFTGNDGTETGITVDSTARDTLIWGARYSNLNTRLSDAGARTMHNAVNGRVDPNNAAVDMRGLEFQGYDDDVDIVLRTQKTGEAHDRLRVRMDGQLRWGFGADANYHRLYPTAGAGWKFERTGVGAQDTTLELVSNGVTGLKLHHTSGFSHTRIDNANGGDHIFESSGVERWRMTVSNGVYGLKINQATTIFAGSGVPAAGTGANGDLYLRTDTPTTFAQRIYIKSAGAWVSAINDPRVDVVTKTTIYAGSYGVVADGVTDDTAALQAAHDAIPTGGGTLKLPPGPIRLTAAIQSSKENLEIEGAGHIGLWSAVGLGATRLVLEGGIWAFIFNNAASSTIFRGPALRHFAVVGNSSSLGGLLLKRVNNVVIEDVVVTGCTTGIGMHSDGTGNVNQYHEYRNLVLPDNKIGAKLTLSNGARFFGGYAEQSSGSPVAGTTALQIVNGDTNKVFGMVLQGYETLADIQSGDGHELMSCRYEAFTTAVKIGSVGAANGCGIWGGSFNNFIVGSGGTAIKVYTAATNTRLWPSNIQSVATIYDDTSTSTMHLRNAHFGLRDNAYLECNESGALTAYDSFKVFRHMFVDKGDVGGQLLFGSAGDTVLYKSATGKLKTDGKMLATGGLGVGNSAAATTPGSVVKKIEIFDASGNSLGFIAVYSSIT